MGNKSQNKGHVKVPLYVFRSTKISDEELREKEIQEALKSKKHKRIDSLVTFENQIDKAFKNLFVKESKIEIANSLQAVRLLLIKLSDKKYRKANFTDIKALLVHLFKSNCHEILEKEEYQVVLFYLFLTSHYWLREVGDWKRNSHNPKRQIGSLLRHLFAKYETPAFLDSMWYDNCTPTTLLFAYIDIAQGKSVRQCSGLPVVMNKRMAHEFMQTPAHYSVNEAIRRAQVLALGGDENLAYYICRSRLGNNLFQEGEFWLSVIHFFAQLELFDNRHVPEMVDYIHFMRFQERRLVDGRMRQGNSDYSMKGRTALRLLEQSQAWHRSTDDKQRHNYDWAKIGFSEMNWVEGEDEKQKMYFITELNSSSLLREEGKQMHHCVYSYARQCASKQSAIFSLRLFKGEYNPIERLATIEVSLRDLRVVQIRAKFNAKVSNVATRFITDWAMQNKLTISTYAW